MAFLRALSSPLFLVYSKFRSNDYVKRLLPPFSLPIVINIFLDGIDQWYRNNSLIEILADLLFLSFPFRHMDYSPCHEFD